MFQGFPNLMRCPSFDNVKWKRSRKYMLHLHVSTSPADGTAPHVHSLSCIGWISGIWHTHVQLHFCVCTFMYKLFCSVYIFLYSEHPKSVIQLQDVTSTIYHLQNTVCLYFNAFPYTRTRANCLWAVMQYHAIFIHEHVMNLNLNLWSVYSQRYKFSFLLVWSALKAIWLRVLLLGFWNSYKYNLIMCGGHSHKDTPVLIECNYLTAEQTSLYSTEFSSLGRICCPPPWSSGDQDGVLKRLVCVISLGYRSGGPGSIPGTTKKKSSGSGTGSTQPREYNWGATW
jgi:hypothetical protein